MTADVDGQAGASSIEAGMFWPMSPFQGIDIGIDRGSPVSWQRYETDGPFPFTGTVRWVRYEPGELAPDAPGRFTDLLREMGSKFE